MSEQAIAIDVRALSKSYRRGAEPTLREAVRRALKRLAGHTSPEIPFWALRDVSFTVHRGETIGILGHNGAGKSTLLRILSRITAPTSGRVNIRGKVSSVLDIGAGFHPDLTGRDNIYLKGVLLGMSKSEIVRVFDEIASFAGLESFMDTPVKRYSSGMTVRLAVGIVVHLNRDVLLIDEALGVGDFRFQAQCIEKISRLSNEGRTVMIASHNTALLRTLCPTSLWIHDGKIAGFGPTQDMVRDYVSAGPRAFPRPDEVPADSAQARVKNVFICGADGVEKDVFSKGEPFLVRLEIEVLKPGKPLLIGLSFFDESGRLILNSQNRDSGMTVQPDPGEARVTARFPLNPLLPGGYRIGFGLMGEKLLQRSFSAATFTVLPFTADGKKYHVDRPQGAVHLEGVSWSCGP